MTTYFVSRHAGAIAWAQQHALSIDAWIEHLDTARLLPGDCVIGTLPIHRVAEVCARGGVYLHLQFDLSAPQRGRELDAADLDALGARLVSYCVTELPVAPPTLKDKPDA